MINTHKTQAKKALKTPLQTKTRKKLGLSQAQLAAIFGHSRNFLNMAEKGKRNLKPASNLLLTGMYRQFHELETGQQSAYRSLETKLFLNIEYKKILPAMQKLEKDCRFKIKMLKKEMDLMKEKARNMEHAIIVFTTAINQLQEEDHKDARSERQLNGLQLFKQQAYNNLLRCWEPEQAKLDSKIEAIKGEAKALRRYRIRVVREHNPFKK